MSTRQTKSLMLILTIIFSVDLFAADYYVRNGGNDNAYGTSDAQAWATLLKVSVTTFGPGDIIYLKRGSVWENEQLYLNSNGTPLNPITLTDYGTGDLPHIKPYGLDTSCIIVNGAQGWKIQNLELSDAQNGILLYYWEDLNNDYINIDNCYIHDCTGIRNTKQGLYNHVSAGISIEKANNQTGDPCFLRNLTITNCTIDNCSFGIWTGDISASCDSNGFALGLKAYVEDFYFENILITNASQTGFSCIWMKNGTVRNMDVSNSGYGSWQYGAAGGLVAHSENILFDGCDIYNSYRGQQLYDGVGFDYEGDTDNITYKNATIWSTDGSGLFIYDNGANAYNTNINISNVNITNFGRNPANSSGGAVRVFGGGHTGTLSYMRLNDSFGRPYREDNYSVLTWQYLETSSVLSVGQPTSATSWSVGYESDKAFDWNWTTDWVAQGGAMPQELWVDLGNIRALTHLEVQFRETSTYNFKLYGSQDELTWPLITSQSGWYGNLFIFNGGGMYRWVKLTIESGGGHWGNCREFTTWGY